MTTESLRILVCGSRSWTDKARLWHVLDLINVVPRYVDVIIHGGAEGADKLAGAWAQYQGLEHVEERIFPILPEDWARHRRGAGPIRNARMLAEGKPTMCLAFRMPGKSSGTDDMIRRAIAARIDTHVICG